jgi:zinc protease
VIAILMKRLHSAPWPILIAASVLPAASTAAAQLPPRPAAAPLHYSAPIARSMTLPNGLTIIVVENHSVPVVAVRLLVKVDSLDDPPGKDGLGAVMLSAMNEGTRSHSSEELERAQARLGTRVTPSRFTTSSRNFDAALSLMAEMTRESVFPAAGVERAKAAITQRYRGLGPLLLPVRVFYDVLWNDPTMARTPSAETIAAITTEDLRRFYHEYVRPENSFLIVVGDIDLQRVRLAATSRFATWQGQARTHHKTIVGRAQAQSTTIHLLDTGPTGSTALFVGQFGPAQTAEHEASLDALAAVLGRGTGSRIQIELRDRRGLFYSGSTYGILWRGRDRPSIQLGAIGVDPKRVDTTLVIWLRSLREIRGAVPVAATELSFARAVTVSSIPAKLETADSVANQITQSVRAGSNFNALGAYVRAVENLTPQDLTDAAREFIDPDHLVILVAGNRQLLEAPLRALNIAPVVIVDENGRPKP